MGSLGITDEMDKKFEETEVGSGGRTKYFSEGPHVATVTAASVGKGKKPWIDKGLHITLTGSNGEVAQVEIEVAPLTDKQGNASDGKMKFLKWQLTALGYDGKLSNLEHSLDTIYGNRVSFKLELVPGKKINPHTGKPYVNADIVLLEASEEPLPLPVPSGTEGTPFVEGQTPDLTNDLPW